MAAAGIPQLSFYWNNMAGDERTISVNLTGTVLHLKQAIEAATNGEYKAGLIKVGIEDPNNASVPILLTDNEKMILDSLPGVQITKDAITIPNNMQLIIFNPSSANPLYDIIEISMPGGVQEKVPLFKLPQWTRDHTEAELRKPNMINKIILREPSPSALANTPNTKFVMSLRLPYGPFRHIPSENYDLSQLNLPGYTMFKGNDEYIVNAANLQGGRRTCRRHRSRRQRSRRHRSRRH